MVIFMVIVACVLLQGDSQNGTCLNAAKALEAKAPKHCSVLLCKD